MFWRIIYLLNLAIFVHALVGYLAFDFVVGPVVLVGSLIITSIYFLLMFLSTFVPSPRN